MFFILLHVPLFRNSLIRKITYAFKTIKTTYTSDGGALSEFSQRVWKSCSHLAPTSTAKKIALVQMRYFRKNIRALFPSAGETECERPTKVVQKGNHDSTESRPLPCVPA